MKRLERVLAPPAAQRPLARLIRASKEHAKDTRNLALRKDLAPEAVVRDSLNENGADKEVGRALHELGKQGFGGPSG